jgi:hypothetical protein
MRSPDAVAEPPQLYDDGSIQKPRNDEVNRE